MGAQIKKSDDLDDDTKNLINDLWCALSLYVEGYPFDEDHKKKHLLLIRRAQIKLRIPKTLEELVSMLRQKQKRESLDNA